MVGHNLSSKHQAAFMWCTIELALTEARLGTF
jgi:hypothetical protein